MQTLFTTSAAALLAVASVAQAQSFEVTEIYPGISGEDGTVDWFEITNTGGGVLDTGSLFWDDDGPNSADGATLDSIQLDSGESAVFLIADNLADVVDDDNFSDVIVEFEAVWGSIDNIGITNGGGNLSQNGDSVNISTDGGLTFPFTVAFGSSFANTGATIDNVSGLTDSLIGVNGAYESNPFFNDNDPFDIGGDQVTLVGSPGVIPTPGAAGLLGIASLAAVRRRR
jgi:MYXO-CTERM domain-containing protein